MKNKLGFTLIELLVVVLIIGILAAVALPQYQKVVWKSRNMQALAIGKTFVDAQHAYQLANGKFATSMEQLDIQIPKISGWSFTGPHEDGHLYFQYKSGYLSWDFFPRNTKDALVCIVLNSAPNTKILNEVCKSVTNSTTYNTDQISGGRKFYTLLIE